MELQYAYEYENALNEVEGIFDAKEGTPEYERLNEVVDAIEEYEKEHFPIKKPTDEAMADFLRDQGVSEKDIPERVRLAVG